MIKIEIIQNHGKGWYWTANITTDNKDNDVAATGRSPKAAVLAAMELLPWFGDSDMSGPEVTS